MGTHGVKVVIIYPRPQDEQAFEKAYLGEHVPLAESKLKGLTRLVLTKVTGSPQGKIAAYRLGGGHFAHKAEVPAGIEYDPGKEVVAHAQAISTGGQPLILFCEEESFVYW